MGAIIPNQHAAVQFPNKVHMLKFVNPNLQMFPTYKRANLGVVYTMNHEVVSRPYAICDWLLNSFRDHFSLQQENNVKVIMEYIF